MKPAQNRAFIQEIKKEAKTDGGIILLNEFVEKEYEVLAVGDLCKALKVGDVIRLYEHAPKFPYYNGFFIRETFGIKVVL